MATDNITTNYVYPLTSQQRGKIFIAQSDPRRTDPIKLAKLQARYGAGNVIIVPDHELVALKGGNVLQAYAAETYTPLIDAIVTSGSTLTDGSTQTYALAAPTNLSVISAVPTTGTDGTAQVLVTVTFDMPDGAIPDTPVFQVSNVAIAGTPITQSVQNLTGVSTAGTKIINVSYDKIANAASYQIQAVNNSTNAIYAKINYSGDAIDNYITVGSTGTYTVTVTPLNSQGMAGTPANIGVTVS